MATIDGHYRLLESSDQQQALNFASTAHYLDYKVTDQRRGIKLREPGVEILEAFQKRGEQDMVRKGKGQATTEEQTGVVVRKQSKTGFSSMRPKQGTKERADAVGEREHLHSTDEIITYLLDTDAIAHQLYGLLHPLVEELGTKTDTPVATLQALVAAYTSGVRSPGADQQAGEIAALLQEVAAEGEEQPVVYLRKLVDRDKKYKEGLAGRYAGTDYANLSWHDLVKIRMPEAALERYRRAVDAVLLHNRAQADPLHRWYINAVVIRDLTGGRNDAVQEYLVTRKEELDAHHEQYHLTARDNRKPIKITTEVDVSALKPGYTVDAPVTSDTKVEEGEPAVQV